MWIYEHQWTHTHTMLRCSGLVKCGCAAKESGERDGCGLCYINLMRALKEGIFQSTIARTLNVPLISSLVLWITWSTVFHSSTALCINHLCRDSHFTGEKEDGNSISSPTTQCGKKKQSKWTGETDGHMQRTYVFILCLFWRPATPHSVHCTLLCPVSVCETELYGQIYFEIHTYHHITLRTAWED